MICRFIFLSACLLASEKQYKPALLDLEKADALQPKTFEILYNLGQAFSARESLQGGSHA